MLKVTEEMKNAAKDYKRRVSGTFCLIEPKNIRFRLMGRKFSVTRKIDGIMAYAVVKNGETALVGSAGRDLSMVPCAKKIGEALLKKGIKDAVVVGELYMPKSGDRPRCYDVLSALADVKAMAGLRIAPFDLVELNGEPFKAPHYSDLHVKLCEIFTDESICPVEMETVDSVSGVEKICSRWVDDEGAEGIVVHSENSVVWKAKPRHTIDAAVVGYTTGDQGLRDLLVAVRQECGKYQVFGVCGNGFEDSQRTELVARLEALSVDSRFVNADSRGIAFRMVRPELVVELSAGEFAAEDIAGNAKYNPLIDFDGRCWQVCGVTPGVSCRSMLFVRFRDDKTADPVSVRVAQLTDLCPFAADGGCQVERRPSRFIRRRVVRKVSGAKVMVQKFVAWKTNKESDPRYPAYVFYHTDYSSGRKDPLKRDLRVAASEEQIMKYFESFWAEKVKKGWCEV